MARRPDRPGDAECEQDRLLHYASLHVRKHGRIHPHDHTARCRNGEYSIRVDEYYFQPEATIMVEAPGYIPQISRGFRNPESYTNDFALKKGKGLSGVVQKADGT